MYNQALTKLLVCITALYRPLSIIRRESLSFIKSADSSLSGLCESIFQPFTRKVPASDVHSLRSPGKHHAKVGHLLPRIHCPSICSLRRWTTENLPACVLVSPSQLSRAYDSGVLLVAKTLPRWRQILSCFRASEYSTVQHRMNCPCPGHWQRR